MDMRPDRLFEVEASKRTETVRAGTGGRVDGRRERSVQSRRRIVAAGIRLIGSGVPTPTAEQIAEAAGVSLRTVFRHFETMDSLSLEVLNRFLDEVLPTLAADAPAGQAPAGALAALIDRRLRLFERMLAFGPAIDVHRHRSERVAARQRELAASWSQELAAAVPSRMHSTPGCLEALDLLLSLEAWQRLRTVQGLSVDDAAAAVRAGVRALTATTGGTN